MPDRISSIDTRRNWIVWRLARWVLSLGSRDYRDALAARGLIERPKAGA